MPFTPFHFGPHACVIFPLRHYIDVPIFIAASIAVDLEPLIVMLYGLKYPLHGYCHTFLVGGLVGLLLGFMAFPFRKFIGKEMSFFHLPYVPSLSKMLISGILGAWLHILFDAPLYGDIKPFYPLLSNPLLGIVSRKVVYGGSALLVIPVFAMYLFTVFSRKAGNEKAS
jgi:hypothetical protein